MYCKPYKKNAKGSGERQEGQRRKLGTLKLKATSGGAQRRTLSSAPLPCPFLHVDTGTASSPAALTQHKVLQDLLQHLLLDLGVGDGVQQPPFLGVGEDDVSQCLAVDLSALQEDLGAEATHDLPIGLQAGLHHW